MSRQEGGGAAPGAERAGEREFARLMEDTFRRLETEALVDDSAEEAWATAATDLERVGRWLRDGFSPSPVADLIEDVIESLFEVRFYFDHDPDEVRAGGAVAKPGFVARVFADEIMALRKAGQQEYAGAGQDAFANFQRIGAELGLDQKVVLWVYAMKHRDGVQSYFNGHRSQREDVRGRLNDLIVYLFLLYGMLADEEGEASERAGERETALREALEEIAAFGCGWDRSNVNPCTKRYASRKEWCAPCIARRALAAAPGPHHSGSGRMNEEEA